MKSKIGFLFFSLLLLTDASLLFSSKKIDGLNDIFKDSKPFWREKAQSPIYLKWDSEATNKDYGFTKEAQPGFKVFLVKESTEIGSIATLVNPYTGCINLDSIYLQPQYGSHITEVFHTLSGIFNTYKSKNTFLSQFHNLFLTCTNENEILIKAAKTAGFNLIGVYNPSQSMIHLIKSIEVKGKTPPKNMQENGEMKQLLQRVSALGEQLDALNKFKGSNGYLTNKSELLFDVDDEKRNPFKPGQSFGQKGARIYLTWETDIKAIFDFENSKDDSSEPLRSGFRIKLRESDKVIGFLTVRCKDKSILFSFFKIDEREQKRGYGTEALKLACSVFVSKKKYFPEITKFLMYSRKDNGPLQKVAEKVGFQFFQNKVLDYFYNYEKPFN